MTDHEIHACLWDLAEIAARLPPLSLRPGERMALSGRRFREAPLLIEDTAAALREEPELFRDVPVDAEALLGRLRRARAYGALQRCLAALAQRAADLALCEEVGAIDEAMGVVRAVRLDAAGPFPAEGAEGRRRRRRAALLVAERHLAGRQERKRRVARDRRRSEAARAPGGAASPGTAALRGGGALPG